MNFLILSNKDYKLDLFNGSNLIINKMISSLDNNKDKVIFIDYKNLEISICEQYGIKIQKAGKYKLFDNLFGKKSILPPLFKMNDRYEISVLSNFFDAIIVFGFENYHIIEFLISNSSNVKVFFFEIDSISMLYNRLILSTFNPFKTIYYIVNYFVSKNIEKILSSSVFKIIFVSSVDAAYHNKHTKFNNTLVLPNGIDDDSKFKEIENEFNHNRAIILSFSGNFSYKPNQLAANFLINTLSKYLFDRNLDFQIHIIGKNPNLSWYKNQFVKKGKIIITGYVDDINTYIKETDIFLSPIFYGAGIKNKILQSLYMGIPIIATNTSFEGINLSLFESSYIISSKNPESWYKAILQIKQNYSQYYSRAKINRSRVRENFSWSNNWNLIKDCLIK